uniref:Uncharacterized protein n=1 Tax=Anopheles dirus TaxID=7168 RepID=A0A182NA69_9DIPT
MLHTNFSFLNTTKPAPAVLSLVSHDISSAAAPAPASLPSLSKNVSNTSETAAAASIISAARDFSDHQKWFSIIIFNPPGIIRLYLRCPIRRVCCGPFLRTSGEVITG